MVDNRIDGGTGSEDVPRSRRERIVDRLQRAAEEFGESMTIREFRESEYDLSEQAIKDEFGTWNEAKEAAGLDTQQRGVTVEIDEAFFERIDDEETAYWLGTLFARSSLQRHALSESPSLHLGRVDHKEYFVTGFLSAIDGEYAVSRYENARSDSEQVQAVISNPRFVENLLATGYPGVDDGPGEFPDLDPDLRPAFVRGYLESKGNFSTGGWNVSVATEARAERLQAWFESFGAKRPTVSRPESEGWVVRVANAFDIESVYAVCWPEALATEPSFGPYAERILEYLREEHPYPENVDYL